MFNHEKKDFSSKGGKILKQGLKIKMAYKGKIKEKDLFQVEIEEDKKALSDIRN